MSPHRRRNILRKQKRQKSEGKKKKKKITNSHKAQSSSNEKPRVISLSLLHRKSTWVANCHFALFIYFFNSQQDVRFCVVLLFHQPPSFLLTGTNSLGNLLWQGVTWRGNLLNSNWRVFPPVDLFTSFNYWWKLFAMGKDTLKVWDENTNIPPNLKIFFPSVIHFF